MPKWTSRNLLLARYSPSWGLKYELAMYNPFHKARVYAYGKRLQIKPCLTFNQYNVNTFSLFWSALHCTKVDLAYAGCVMQLYHTNHSTSFPCVFSFLCPPNMLSPLTYENFILRFWALLHLHLFTDEVQTAKNAWGLKAWGLSPLQWLYHSHTHSFIAVPCICGWCVMNGKLEI